MTNREALQQRLRDYGLTRGSRYDQARAAEILVIPKTTLRNWLQGTRDGAPRQPPDWALTMLDRWWQTKPDQQ